MAKKPVVSTAPDAPATDAATPVRHIVLKQLERKVVEGKDAKGVDVVRKVFRPLMSFEYGDATADDQIAAIKVEAINRARHAGAAVPEFKIVHEIEGKEVEAI